MTSSPWGIEMNKKDRLEAVFDLREPDVIPVNPHVMAQAIYDMGWSLREITTQTELDSDKVAEAFVSNIKKYDYDLCFELTSITVMEFHPWEASLRSLKNSASVFRLRNIQSVKGRLEQDQKRNFLSTH